MVEKLRVAVVGDYNPSFVSHPATTNALPLAAESLGFEATVDWVPTPEVREEELASYDGPLGFVGRSLPKHGRNARCHPV